MEKQAPTQLELFSQLKEARDGRTKRSPGFIAAVWGHEKALMIAIGFIITGIISFSIGVESGKMASVARTNARLELAATEPLPKAPAAKQPPAAAVEPDPVPVAPKEQAVETQGYTVQVASFKSKSHAQREADTLKKRGFSALVLSKGSYSIVCIGPFSNKEKAQSKLSELKKSYSDCYIRRL